MSVDDDYWSLLEQQKKQKLEEVHKECANEMEKALMLRKKITERLMPNIIGTDIYRLSLFPCIDTSLTHHVVTVEEMRLSAFPEYKSITPDDESKSSKDFKALDEALTRFDDTDKPGNNINELVVAIDFKPSSI